MHICINKLIFIYDNYLFSCRVILKRYSKCLSLRCRMPCYNLLELVPNISILIDNNCKTCFSRENQHYSSNIVLFLHHMFTFYRYLNAAKIGDDIVIDANTLKVGKKLAYLTVDIKSKTNGKLLAQGKHTKFFSD